MCACLIEIVDCHLTRLAVWALRWTFIVCWSFAVFCLFVCLFFPGILSDFLALSITNKRKDKGWRLRSPPTNLVLRASLSERPWERGWPPTPIQSTIYPLKSPPMAPRWIQQRIMSLLPNYWSWIHKKSNFIISFHLPTFFARVFVFVNPFFISNGTEIT